MTIGACTPLSSYQKTNMCLRSIAPPVMIFFALAVCVSSLPGLLAVGTRSTLSVYTLILENDLPTWSLKWSSAYAQYPTCCCVCTFMLYRTVSLPFPACAFPPL